MNAFSGICPQHDVLFDNMTVEEHLRFFCRLKGVEDSRVQHQVRLLRYICNLASLAMKQETLCSIYKRAILMWFIPPFTLIGQIDDMVDSLKLGEKRHKFAKTLSGGQKRRLSCGIAIVGGSKVCNSEGCTVQLQT